MKMSSRGHPPQVWCTDKHDVSEVGDLLCIMYSPNMVLFLIIVRLFARLMIMRQNALTLTGPCHRLCSHDRWSESATHLQMCVFCRPSGLWLEQWAEDGGGRTPGRGAARPRPAATGEESNHEHIKVHKDFHPSVQHLWIHPLLFFPPSNCLFVVQ